MQSFVVGMFGRGFHCPVANGILMMRKGIVSFGGYIPSIFVDGRMLYSCLRGGLLFYLKTHRLWPLYRQHFAMWVQAVHHAEHILTLSYV